MKMIGIRIGGLALSAALIVTPGGALAQSDISPEVFEPVLEEAAALEPLETVIIAHEGVIVAERAYRGNSIASPQNIKSASKTIMSALVGIAIERGVLEGVDQPIAPLLDEALPPDPDPRINEITIGNLLSMQAGLERTSNENYGRWTASENWVRSALAQPFVADPGTGMQYSTGSTHLLSAILTKLTGRSTLAVMEDWLSPIEDFEVAGWEQDPQGIYLGGNQFSIRPHALLAFGEIYRNGGKTPDGERVVSPEWIAQSWEQRTVSCITGDGYGYGWFLREIGGEPVRFAWGYGGQMLYVVPSVDLTVVMTSNESLPSAETDHLDNLAAVLEEIIALVR